MGTDQAEALTENARVDWIIFLQFDDYGGIKLWNDWLRTFFVLLFKLRTFLTLAALTSRYFDSLTAVAEGKI